MPRSHDGPIPQRPERNELSGRMGDIFDQFGPGRPSDQGDGGLTRIHELLADRPGHDGVRPDRDFRGLGNEDGGPFTPRGHEPEATKVLDVGDWFL